LAVGVDGRGGRGRCDLLGLAAQQAHVGGGRAGVHDHRRGGHESHGRSVPDAADVAHHYGTILVVIGGNNLVLPLRYLKTTTVRYYTFS